METYDWFCERHPWLGWPHGECAGPGMPQAAVLGITEAMAALVDSGCAFRIERDETGPVRVRLATYQARLVADERLGEDQWLVYEHENIMGAIVTAVTDVRFEAKDG